MSKRKWMWLAVLLLLIGGGVGLLGLLGEHQIVLSEEQIQQHIDKKLDSAILLTGVARAFLTKASLEKVTVNITDNKVLAAADVSGVLRVGGKKFSLSSFAIGVPSYADGKFYFSPEKIEIRNFAYEGGTPAETLREYARRYIESDKRAQFIEDKAPKIEAWVTQTAENAIVHALERRPVYELKDDLKGYVIRASLKSVEVENNNLVVTFSLWELSLSVLLGVLAVVVSLALAVALMTNPQLGVPVLLLF